jgi:hypothetical protein
MKYVFALLHSVHIFLENLALCHPRVGGDPENKREMSYHVYILNSKRNGNLYI